MGGERKEVHGSADGVDDRAESSSGGRQGRRLRAGATDVWRPRPLLSDHPRLTSERRLTWLGRSARYPHSHLLSGGKADREGRGREKVAEGRKRHGGPVVVDGAKGEGRRALVRGLGIYVAYRGPAHLMLALARRARLAHPSASDYVEWVKGTCGGRATSVAPSHSTPECLAKSSYNSAGKEKVCNSGGLSSACPIPTRGCLNTARRRDF